MAFLCSGKPVEGDPYAQKARQWETGMLRSCCNNPLGCCGAIICAPCCVCYLRKEALNGDWSKYSCCQGFVCGKCASCIPMQQSCPQLCLCLEAICCESCAISGTRMYVQAERQIQSDPCDNRIIRFTNCMQCLSCICNILACFDDSFRELARIIDLIADVIYCMVQACMQAQTHHELKLHPTVNDYGSAGGAGHSSGGGYPQAK
eukprot:m.11542 g.11542  ORF g.11542 m.11542 type:complete len:205 (+) comp9840_c0_seq1:61-675(+)